MLEPWEGVAIQTWAEQTEIAFIRAMCNVGSDMSSYTYGEIAHMHLICGVVNCDGLEAIQMSHKKYPDRKLPCLSLFANVHRRLCETSWFDVQKSNMVAKKHLGQFLQDKMFSNNWNIIFQRGHELYLETLISSNRVAHWTYGLRPFHLQRVQVLESEDYNKRMEIARWFL